MGKSDDVQFALGHCGHICARRDVAKDSCLSESPPLGLALSSASLAAVFLLQPANLPEDSEERQDLVIAVLYRLVFTSGFSSAFTDCKFMHGANNSAHQCSGKSTLETFFKDGSWRFFRS